MRHFPGFTAETSIYKTGIYYHTVCTHGETGGIGVKADIVSAFRKPKLNCGPCYWDLYGTGGCVQDCHPPICPPTDPFCSDKQDCATSACPCRPVGIECTTSSDCCSGWCNDNGVCDQPCLPVSAPCDKGADCCSGWCNENLQCDCFATGEECHLGARSCCSGQCSAGTCL